LPPTGIRLAIAVFLKRLVAILSATGLLLTGCGDDDDPPEPTPELTKTEYIEEADLLCSTEELGRTIEAGVPEREYSSWREESADSIRRLADFQEEFLEHLEALTPPQADEKLIDRWLYARQQQINIWRDDSAPAIEEDDRPRLRAIAARIRQLQTEELALAAQYGMKDCSEPQDEPKKRFGKKLG
jgi:hypothetical protein